MGDNQNVLYRCGSPCTGGLVVGDNLYISHRNGTLVQFSLRRNRVLRAFHIENTRFIYHTQTHSLEPDDLQILRDSAKGEIITYRLSTQEKKVRVSGLLGPAGFSVAFYNHSRMYVVPENQRHRVIIYDADWRLIKTFGGSESLKYPLSCFVTPEGTVVVADQRNHRISEFTMEGELVQHVIVTSKEGLRPNYITLIKNHLWAVYYPYSVRRYKMYE